MIKNSQLETLVWALIYGGMALGMLGVWIIGRDAALGQGLAVAGGLAVLVGLLLIWLRSRLPAERGEDPPQ